MQPEIRSHEPTLPEDDHLLGMLVQFFVDGEDFDTAGQLLYCRMEVTFDGEYQFKLVAPRRIYDQLAREDAFMETVGDRVRAALTAVLAALNVNFDPAGLVFAPELTTIGADWRLQLAAAVDGKSAHNQAVGLKKAVVWNDLRFRSAAELRIAQALEKAQVLYLPNCKASLGYKIRETREPDFLICHRGRWGILQIDGEPFRPQSGSAQQTQSDSVIREHGIRIIEYYQAAQCLEDANGVVQHFLKTLAEAYS